MKHVSNMHVVNNYDMHYACMACMHVLSRYMHVTLMLHA